MRHSFRHIFSRQPTGGPTNEFYPSPFASITRNGIKLLLLFALILIGLGILVLIFPRVLAFFVAALFFLLALGCLNFAWRLWRAGRAKPPSDQSIHVEFHQPPPEDYS